jgi:hypothetical protein
MVFIANFVVGYYLSTYESRDLRDAGLEFSYYSWKDFYALEENLDLLILGSSHALRSYNPSIISRDLTGAPLVFNFGTPAQSPRTSYFILKEVLQHHQPQLVVFDVYFMVFTSDEQLKNGRLAYQQMHSGEAKNDFLLYGFSLSEMATLKLFPSYLYRNRIKPKIKKIFGQPYLPEQEGTYQGYGFAPNEDTVAMKDLYEGNQFDFFTVDTSDMTKINCRYLEKMIKLCRDHKVDIVFAAAPMPEITVKKVPTYDQFYQFFGNVAKRSEMDYLDFNLDRPATLKDSFHFFNDDHLNESGAAIFSHAVAERLKAYFNDPL